MCLPYFLCAIRVQFHVQFVCKSCTFLLSEIHALRVFFSLQTEFFCAIKTEKPEKSYENTKKTPQNQSSEVFLLLVTRTGIEPI